LQIIINIVSISNSLLSGPSHIIEAALSLPAFFIHLLVARSFWQFTCTIIEFGTLQVGSSVGWLLFRDGVELHALVVTGVIRWVEVGLSTLALSYLSFVPALVADENDSNQEDGSTTTENVEEKVLFSFYLYFSGLSANWLGSRQNKVTLCLDILVVLLWHW